MNRLDAAKCILADEVDMGDTIYIDVKGYRIDRCRKASGIKEHIFHIL